jgi:hypothetical protein
MLWGTLLTRADLHTNTTGYLVLVPACTVGMTYSFVVLVLNVLVRYQYNVPGTRYLAPAVLHSNE